MLTSPFSHVEESSHPKEKAGLKDQSLKGDHHDKYWQLQVVSYMCPRCMYMCMVLSRGFSGCRSGATSFGGTSLQALGPRVPEGIRQRQKRFRVMQHRVVGR